MKKNKIYIKMIISGILSGFSLILLFLSKSSQGFSDWYSKYIYSFLVTVFGRLMGVFPFSIVEILLYMIILLLILGMLRFLVLVVQRKMNKTWAYSKLATMALVMTGLVSLYVVNCGVNYNRTSFSKSSNIEMREYSKEDLKQVCYWLKEKVTVLSKEIKRDNNGEMLLTGDIQTRAREAMQDLSKEYPELSGYYPKPKGLIFSQLLSMQQLSGIYSPFTIEANYNNDMLDYYIPFTTCHELSHLRGFMQEEEANFIAFLACISSDDIDFQYSGYMLGLSYCMNTLYKIDYEAWEQVNDQLPVEIKNEYEKNIVFWNQYDGFLANVANQMNDMYLKANGQEKGVNSYSQMVNLIVSYYLQEDKE